MASLLMRLKHERDGGFLQTRTLYFVMQNGLIFQAYTHFKTPILLFKSLLIFLTQQYIFQQLLIFLNNPLPPPHVKLQSCM